MGSRIGLDDLKLDDVNLINEFEKTLRMIKPDMTIFYQLLIDLPLNMDNKHDVVDHFKGSFYKELSQMEVDTLYNLTKVYVERIGSNTITREESVMRMRKTNPRIILRNYMLHQAIEDLEKGNDGLFVKLQEAMKEPYSKKFDEFFAKRPSWATQKAGCSMLSCSS
jgi:uncharacterized protein YdiU (UPF0061 family)